MMPNLEVFNILFIFTLLHISNMKENHVPPGQNPQSRLLLEYDSLKKYSPSGIYTLPCISNPQVWQSIIFVRQGYYKDGVFPFTISIPKDYPDSKPTIRFATFIYHPLIDSETGQLSLEGKFSNWTPGKDFIFSVLAYVKQIFYFQDLWTVNKAVLNPLALACVLREPEVFVREAQSCVLAAREADLGVFKQREFNSIHKVVLGKIREANERPSEFLKFFVDKFLQE